MNRKYFIIFILFFFKGLLCFSQQSFEKFIDYKINNVSSLEYGYKLNNYNDSTNLLVCQVGSYSELDTFNNLSVFTVFYKFKFDGTIIDSILLRKKNYRIEPKSIIELNNNFYLLTQTIDYVAEENLNQGRYLELYKLNKNLDTIWSKQIKFNNNQHFSTKTLLIDSNKIAIFGTYYKDANTKNDIFYNLFDTSGNELILSTYSFTSNSNETIGGAINNGNRFYIWGSTSVSNKKREGFVLKIDKSGNLINKNIIGDTIEQVNSFDASNIELVNNNKFIACGSNLNTDEYTNKGVCYEIDSNLKFRQTRDYYKDYNKFIDVQYHRNRYYILGGQFRDFLERESYGILLCYDTSGVLLWERTFDYINSYKDLVPYSFLYQNNSIYITGFGSYINSTNTLVQDTWLIKTDSLGCLIGGCNTTFVDLKTNNIRIYPNPANDFITVFSDEKLNDVKFRIIDFKGKVLLNGTLQNEKIDLSNINRGLYILELKYNSNNIIHMKFVKE